MAGAHFASYPSHPRIPTIPNDPHAFFVNVIRYIIIGSKSKKLDGSGAAARLSEEGKVQLLSITEKAGVEGTDTSGSGIPEAVQAEQGPAETAADTKEDDKRVVTVATFGFPEVAILPPPATTEEENEAEAKEVVDTAEKKEVQKDANKEEGTSATDVGHACMLVQAAVFYLFSFPFQLLLTASLPKLLQCLLCVTPSGREVPTHCPFLLVS